MTLPPPELLHAMTEHDADEPLSAEAEDRMKVWLRARVARIPAQRRKRLQQRRVVAASALAFAAAAAVVIAVQVQPDPAPEAVATQLPPNWRVQLAQGATLTWSDAAGSEHALHQAGSLHSPGGLQTDGAASARVTTPDGVDLRLAPSTRLRTPSPRDTSRSEVELAQGAVEVQVPPLGTQRSFRVRTRDTEVIVHGTRFRVELRDEGHEVQTCVRVQEGKVEVRNPRGVRFLGAGQTEGCEPSARPRMPTARPAAKRAASTARPHARPNAVRTATKASRGEAAKPGSEAALVDQNRLLMRALASERNGDLEAAGRAFEQLLSRHPQSPLAPDARRGLARVR